MSYFKRIISKFVYYFSYHHIRVWARDLFYNTEAIRSDKTHLDTSMEWLITTSEKTGNKGVPFSYSFRLGWMPPYPETTGYIIDSFLEYYNHSGIEKYLQVALELADWEIDIQLPSGGIRMQRADNTIPDVFDTGMVILGLTTIYKKTGHSKYLISAQKAADWLVSVQDEDGKWIQFSYKNVEHAYHTKVAWSLYKMYILTNDIKYKEACEKNIRWALLLKEPNGWYRCMGFSHDEEPYTHTMAYTMQGFMETYKLMENSNPLKSIILSEILLFCDKLIKTFNLENETGEIIQLPGSIDSNWKKTSDYACLTGNAQFAIVFYDLYKLTNNDKYYIAATTLLNIVKKTHMVDGIEAPYKLAIAGSYPIWGKYHPNEYPNWATKFFADALLAKIKLDELTEIA